jgi:hypothetical protein
MSYFSRFKNWVSARVLLHRKVRVVNNVHFKTSRRGFKYSYNEDINGQSWWPTPIIPALGRLRPAWAT